MRTTSKNTQMRKSIVFAAILACLVVAGAGSAFAGTNPFLRNLSDQTFDGQCCVSFGESVSITEPATPVTVIVTWSTDYAVNVADAYFAGLSVNGGECQTQAYGPRLLADNPGSGSSYTSATFQCKYCRATRRRSSYNRGTRALRASGSPSLQLAKSSVIAGAMVVGTPLIPTSVHGEDTRKLKIISIFRSQ